MYNYDPFTRVVEWPERAGSLIPPTAKHIVFSHLDGEERRRLAFL